MEMDAMHEEEGCPELDDLMKFVTGLGHKLTDRTPERERASGRSSDKLELSSSGYVMMACRDSRGTHITMLPLNAFDYERVVRGIDRGNRSFNSNRFEGDGSETQGGKNVDLSLDLGEGIDPMVSCMIGGGIVNVGKLAAGSVSHVASNPTLAIRERGKGVVSKVVTKAAVDVVTRLHLGVNRISQLKAITNELAEDSEHSIFATDCLMK